MTLRWTPKSISGFSRSICIACAAPGHGTIKLVEQTTPCLIEPRTASLTASDIPKSSAFTMSKRASSPYPNKLFALLVRMDWQDTAIERA